MDDKYVSDAVSPQSYNQPGLVEKGPLYGDTKLGEVPEAIRQEEDDGSMDNEVAETAADLVTHVIHVEDDPTLNPWTFRMVFLGKSFPRGIACNPKTFD